MTVAKHKDKLAAGLVVACVADCSRMLVATQNHDAIVMRRHEWPARDDLPWNEASPWLAAGLSLCFHLINIGNILWVKLFVGRLVECSRMCYSSCRFGPASTERLLSQPFWPDCNPRTDETKLLKRVAEWQRFDDLSDAST